MGPITVCCRKAVVDTPDLGRDVAVLGLRDQIDAAGVEIGAGADVDRHRFGDIARRHEVLDLRRADAAGAEDDVVVPSSKMGWPSTSRLVLTSVHSVTPGATMMSSAKTSR